MEVGGVATMPATVPARTPAAADYDVRSAVIVVIAARIALVAAVVIGRRAASDAHAKRTRVESDLRHCRRRRGRREKRRGTKSKRKFPHHVPPVVVALR
jgi:hypothetical protein